MKNSWFQFKQFRIEQADCAMKVCTDACILGAWYASRINPVCNILDIGSGTGLLMMMLAQQAHGLVHGIEIEGRCYNQLVQNIQSGNWRDRMSVYQGDVRGYTFPLAYDFIISNPPFYENDLKGSHDGRQLAMHSTALKLADLAGSIADNLSQTGNAGVLLPYHRAGDFDREAASAGLVASERLIIRHTERHPWFRTITTYTKATDGRKHMPLNETLPLSLSGFPVLEAPSIAGLINKSQNAETANVQSPFNGHALISRSETWMLTIRDEKGNYTPAFEALLAPYYLDKT